MPMVVGREAAHTPSRFSVRSSMPATGRGGPHDSRDELGRALLCGCDRRPRGGAEPQACAPLITEHVRIKVAFSLRLVLSTQLAVLPACLLAHLRRQPAAARMRSRPCLPAPPPAGGSVQTATRPGAAPQVLASCAEKDSIPRGQQPDRVGARSSTASSARLHSLCWLYAPRPAVAAVPVTWMCPDTASSLTPLSIHVWFSSRQTCGRWELVANPQLGMPLSLT